MPTFLLAVLALVRPSCAAPDASYAESLVARSRELRLAQDPAWLALGHYRKTLFGSYESEVLPSAFFVSPAGPKDPEAELEATLKAFFATDGPDPQAKYPQPQCRFPARYAWLSRRLDFDPARLPPRRCARFEEWRDAIDASSVTVVFADAFLNNPGSMYGHTFLRLRRKDSLSDGSELLDYTINFAGTPTTDNGVLYAVDGILGLFPASYSTLPYYMKVQEYTNIESRDLWEYDLSLSSAQVDQLLRHSWEMGSAKFNYYFFSQNCSYQLLTLLDAADPSAGLAQRFGFGVVPLDTLRATKAELGAGSPPRYRPSHVTQMLAHRSRLSSQEISLATKLGRSSRPADWDLLRTLPPERQALVLDSADDYLRYRCGFSSDLPAGVSARERGLLVARGRLGLPPQEAPVTQPLAPDLGHATSRAGLGFGSDGKNGPFTELDFRAALHDLADGDSGYIPNSQLEMGDARLRFNTRSRQGYVERLDLVNIVSLAPWDPWIHRISWKASTGVDQAREYGCDGPGCMYYNLNAGGGLSAATSLWRHELYYGLLETDWGAGPVLAAGWRAGAGGTAGLLFELWRSARIQAEATYIGYQAGPAREQLRGILAWNLARNLEARFTVERRVPSNEAGLSLLAYF